MKRLFISIVLAVSIIFISLGFKILKKEKWGNENKDVIELVDKMDASFNLLPFELSLEEKIKIVQNQKSISDIYEQKYLSLPDPPNWDCASLCWGQFSNCWKGLDYLKRGSESWAKEVNKCFGDVSKCYKKCRKEKNVGGPIQ